MTDFQDAQQLFDEYQKNGDFHNLRNCLDTLEDTIDSSNAESQKAIKFKKTISRHIDNQLNNIFSKYNIREFTKELKGVDDKELLLNKLSEVLSGSLSIEDEKLFLELLDIKINYFKQH